MIRDSTPNARIGCAVGEAWNRLEGFRIPLFWRNAVPRYFFHVVDGQKYRDPAGIELASDNEACQHAKAYAKTVGRFHHDPSMEVRVTNDDGAVVFRVPLHDGTE